MIAGGTSDFVVWRPSDAVWYVLTSGSGFTRSFTRQWGRVGDIPVGGSDFDGDGTSDFAVWRPSDAVRPRDAVWEVLTSRGGFTRSFSRQWGTGGDIPVGGSDFDGDGVSDLVVWRPSDAVRPRDAVWYVRTSGSNFTTFFSRQWGTGGDIPVGGLDFDEDGVSDLVVWRPSDGVWYVRNGSGFDNFFTQQWGTGGDIPVVSKLMLIP